MGAILPPHGGNSPKSVAETAAGQDGAEQHQAWSSSLLGVLLPYTAPTHRRWFCGPAITPAALGDVALPEHSVPLSLHVLLVRVVLPLNEVGLPQLPGPVVPHMVLPSAAAAVWHRIGPMESTYGPPAPRSGALSGAAAGMGGWAKAPWARRWERVARSTLHAAVVARRGEFRQGRGKVLLRLSVRHQGRRAGAAERSVTCRAGRLGAGPDSPTPPPTHPSPWGWAVGVGGWGGWRGWGRPGQGWAGRCPGLGGYPSSPGWVGRSV